eukprot:353939-Chlamydomonas_euryale.AAC.5
MAVRPKAMTTPRVMRTIPPSPPATRLAPFQAFKATRASSAAYCSRARQRCYTSVRLAASAAFAWILRGVRVTRGSACVLREGGGAATPMPRAVATLCERSHTQIVRTDGFFLSRAAAPQSRPFASETRGRRKGKRSRA